MFDGIAIEKLQDHLRSDEILKLKLQIAKIIIISTTV